MATVEEHIREDTVRALIRALPERMVISFPYHTNHGDATTFVLTHLLDAAAKIGVKINTEPKNK